MVTEVEQHLDGKGHGGKGVVHGYAKNMPSFINVIGAVDRLYRPHLATEVFGDDFPFFPPQPTPPSRRFFPRETPDVDVKLHHPKDHDNRRPATVSSPPHMRTEMSGGAIALTESQRRAVLDKISDLQLRLVRCDKVIESREDEMRTLSAMRDLHIARRKSAVRHLRNDVLLSRQPDVEALLTHQMAEMRVNKNPLTDPMGVPLHSGKAIPGEDRGRTADSSQKGDAVASTFSEHWRAAKGRTPTELLRRAVVPKVPAQQMRFGKRIFPEQHMLAAPFGIEDDASTPQRVLQHATLSNPTQWLQREVDRSVKKFNQGVLFHERTEPHLRKPTIKTASEAGLHVHGSGSRCEPMR